MLTNRRIHLSSKDGDGGNPQNMADVNFDLTKARIKVETPLNLNLGLIKSLISPDLSIMGTSEIHPVFNLIIGQFPVPPFTGNSSYYFYFTDTKYEFPYGVGNLNNVYIIDWEHFHLEIAPLGFDILFMVFELLKMEFKNTRPTVEKLYLAKKLIMYAVSKGVISSSYQNNYFSSFLVEQDGIKFIWKDQYHKLPTTQFTALQTQVLTDYFK